MDNAVKVQSGYKVPPLSAFLPATSTARAGRAGLHGDAPVLADGHAAVGAAAGEGTWSPPPVVLVN
jgi:hypothetical protein